MLYSCKVQATGSRLKYGSPARLRRYDLDDNVDQPKKVPMKRAARTRLAERARYMRKNMTEAEKILWFRFLREYPIRFSNQIIVGPYIVALQKSKVKHRARWIPTLRGGPPKIRRDTNYLLGNGRNQGITFPELIYLGPFRRSVRDYSPRSRTPEE